MENDATHWGGGLVDESVGQAGRSALPELKLRFDGSVGQTDTDALHARHSTKDINILTSVRIQT